MPEPNIVVRGAPSPTRDAVRVLVFTSALASGGALACGCGLVEGIANDAIRSQTIVEMRNTPTPLADAPGEADEISFIYQRGLSDAYFDFWTAKEDDPFGADRAADPIATAVFCAGRRLTPTANAPIPSTKPCFDALFGALGLDEGDARMPLVFERHPKPSARRERDVVRLETLLQASVFAAVNFLRANYPAQLREAGPDDHLPADPGWAAVRDGVREGLRHFTAYQVAHARVASRDRSPTAIVLSGGAANGAFSAGGVWFLLHQLAKCTECAGKARVDMVAAASTGALVGILIKDFFSPVPGHAQIALDTLTDSYLCKVDADLYCVTDAGVIDLGITGGQGGETGLVRFSGISKLIDAHIDAHTLDAPVEYFASTTEFQSGRLYDFSSLDPADITDAVSLRQAVLSSIPEPGMAEPIYHVGKHSGFFIDGGVRSGLPVLPPILGGAEHVLAFVNQQSDLLPYAKPPGNALAALFRSIDLFTFQPIVAELGQGEFQLATRRAAEYELCMDRAAARARHEGKPLDYEPANAFCSYRTGGGPESEPRMRGKPALRSLEPLYQSSQVFQPRVVPAGFEDDVGPLTNLNAAGYAFDPQVMWRQFVLGAATVEERCAEIVTALGWWPDTPFDCESAGDLKKELGALHASLTRAGCYEKKSGVRVCGKSDPPISTP